MPFDLLAGNDCCRLCFGCLRLSASASGSRVFTVTRSRARHVDRRRLRDRPRSRDALDVASRASTSRRRSSARDVDIRRPSTGRPTADARSLADARAALRRTSARDDRSSARRRPRDRRAVPSVSPDVRCACCESGRALVLRARNGTSADARRSQQRVAVAGPQCCNQPRRGIRRERATPSRPAARAGASSIAATANAIALSLLVATPPP